MSSATAPTSPPLETVASYWVTDKTLLLISKGSVVDFKSKQYQHHYAHYQQQQQHDDLVESAIVNAANTTCIADFMRPGNTIDQAVSRAGGERFLAARLELPIVEGGDTRCVVGDAKLTSGRFGRLGVTNVIDAVGPNYHDYEYENYKEADELLLSAYKAALERASDVEVKEMAFALLSVNDRGQRSLKQLCAVAVSAVVTWVQANPDTSIQLILLCASNDKESRKLFESCQKFGFVSEEEALALEEAQANNSNKNKSNNKHDF